MDKLFWLEYTSMLHGSINKDTLASTYEFNLRDKWRHSWKKFDWYHISIYFMLPMTRTKWLVKLFNEMVISNNLLH